MDKFGGIWSEEFFWEKRRLLLVYCLCLVMLINILKRLLKFVSTIFCQFFLFSLKDSPSKIIKNVFLFNCSSSFCSCHIQIFVIFSWVASEFCNEDSRTIQEHLKNISILFKNTSDVENVTIDLKVFFQNA